MDIGAPQLKFANGFSLKDFKLPEKPKGHAIEARICAEDPFNSFLPTIGDISLFEYNNQHIINSDRTMGFDLYDNRSNIRLDFGVIENSRVTPYYDSMIGKLIVYGKDRAEAVALLSNALQSLRVGGIQTNIPFILNLFKNKQFIDFNYSLNYFDTYKSELLKEPQLDYSKYSIFAAVDVITSNNLREGDSLRNVRNNAVLSKQLRFSITKAFSSTETVTDLSVDISQSEPGSKVFNVNVIDQLGNSKMTKVEIVCNNGAEIVLIIDGMIVKERIYRFGSYVSVCFDGVFYKIENQTYKSISGQTEKDSQNQIKSPMPGIITKINCLVDQTVKKGDVLFTIEAMKMEHKVTAKSDLKITKINYKEKSFVELGGLVVETQSL